MIIEVKDTGIGIEQDELPFLFDRFYRSQTARIHFPDGTELAYAIAKTIIDQHQGVISVSSEPGKGSLFYAQFPIIRIS